MKFFNRFNRQPEEKTFVMQPPTSIQQNFLYEIGSIVDRPSAHAANIIEGGFKNGVQTMYTAWFSGTREGNLDVAILFSKITYTPQEDVSEIKFTYSSPKVIADFPDKALGNPVLFLDPHQKMYLWFVAFDSNGTKPRVRSRHRKVYHQTSTDFGTTWTDPTIFSIRDGWWPKNTVMILQDGTWLLPLNDEATMIRKYKTYWASMFGYSTDEGKNWEFTNLYSIKKGMIQPSVVEFDDGILFCLNRGRNHRLGQMYSKNHGRTWTEPEYSELPTNNSNAIQIRCSNGDLLICFNPTTRGRSPISIAQSKDKGKTWTRLFNLQNENGFEFSYPCMWETPDGIIHVVYTYKRLTICHDVFRL